MTQLDSTMFQTAKRFLSKHDPVMKKLIKRSISFAMNPDLEQSPFEALTRAVASQQLHGAAAAAILRRFIALVPEKSFPDPDDVAHLTDEQIRSAGFSRSKILTIRDLTEKVIKGIVPTHDEINVMDDDAIVSRISSWTRSVILSPITA